MKTFGVADNAVLVRARDMGFLIQESISVEKCYFIVDMNTNLVIAGAQDFLAWDEVVQWVVEADNSSTLN